MLTAWGSRLALGGLLGLLLVYPAAADNGWPTPPPAPIGPRPRIETSVTPVTVPPVAGAVRWEVQPRPPALIPAIPPLPSDTFEAPSGVKVTIEAGALDRTIQLTYVPVSPAEAAAPDRLQRLVAAFDLNAFDHRGNEFSPQLRRPWIVEVPVQRLPGPTGDPTRLVLARFAGGRWIPQVTGYFRDSNTLTMHILQTGRYAVLAELRPS